MAIDACVMACQAFLMVERSATCSGIPVAGECGPSRLVLKGRRIRELLPSLATAWAALVGLFYGRAGGMEGAWRWILAGMLLIVILCAVVVALLPVQLIADEHGLTWKGPFKSRRLAWQDIEVIGVSLRRPYEGWDHPVVELITNGRPRKTFTNQSPMIGVTMKPHAALIKGAGNRAYVMGFTGFELNLPCCFELSAKTVVEELQVRLERARRTLPSAP